MLELRYGLLCDHAAIGHNGKAIALHIFENVIQIPTRLGDPLPPFFLLAKLEGSVVDGSTHDLAASIVDEDGKRIFNFPLPGFELSTQGPGLPLVGTVLMQVNGLRLKRYGSYSVELRTATARIGAVDFRLIRPPAGPA